MASPARLRAQRAQIQQVVSYVTLHNVTIDGGSETLVSNEMKLPMPQPVQQQQQQQYQQQQHYQQQQLLNLSSGPSSALSLNGGTLNDTGYNPTGPNNQLNSELMFLWLGVFLAIPLLIALLCFCLCVNRKDDALNKSLIEKDSEVGDSEADQKKTEDE